MKVNYVRNSMLALKNISRKFLIILSLSPYYPWSQRAEDSIKRQ